MVHHCCAKASGDGDVPDDGQSEACELGGRGGNGKHCRRGVEGDVGAPNSFNGEAEGGTGVSLMGVKVRLVHAQLNKAGGYILSGPDGINGAAVVFRALDLDFPQTNSASVGHLHGTHDVASCKAGRQAGRQQHGNVQPGSSMALHTNRYATENA